MLAGAAVLIALLSQTACVGAVDPSRDVSGSEGQRPPRPDPETGPPDPARPPTTGPGEPGASFRPGPAALRRLTRRQYEHAIQDLLGPAITLPAGLELDTVLSGFAAIGASLTTLSETVTEKLETAALGIATQALGNPERRAQLVPCTPAGPWDEPCARSFVTTFGRRAWRRPLVPEEVTQYLGIARQGAEMFGDFWQGLTYALSGILQSPNFLYRVEIGKLDPASGRRAFDDWELASRLSFFLASTTPDNALLDAASAGTLSQPGGLRRQAERLLESPRGRTAVRDFLYELLRLDALDDLEQSPADFPVVTPTLGPSMREETLRFVEEIIWGAGDYRLVFDTRTTFVNRELARLYGLTPPAGAGFERVELPEGSLRVGLLGQAAFLAPNAHEQTTSPTRRGKFMREVLLCHEIPEPPADVDTTLPPERPGTPPRTMREKLEVHNAPACVACHAKMDPLGLAFENFDAIGKLRTAEAGKRIDASGELDGQAFAGPAELAAILRRHPDVQECLVRGLWRYALGRVETEGEEALVKQLAANMDGTDRFRTLLFGLVESDGFRLAGDNP
jgi:hypothetical protein